MSVTLPTIKNSSTNADDKEKDKITKAPSGFRWIYVLVINFLLLNANKKRYLSRGEISHNIGSIIFLGLTVSLKHTLILFKKSRAN